MIFLNRVNIMQSEIEYTITTPVYKEAVEIVIKYNYCSIIFIQQTLGIGFNYASRLVEAMEHEGIIGKMQPDGTHPVIRKSRPV